MKKRHYLSLLCTGMLMFSSAFGQTFFGQEARNIVPGTAEVEFENFTQVPTFVRFVDNYNVPFSHFERFARQNFHLDKDYGFKTWRVNKDELGYSHIKMQQTYQNIPVEYSMYIAHVQDGVIKMMNGEVYSNVKNVNVTPSISEAQALTLATKYIGASVYKWQLPTGNAKAEDIPDFMQSAPKGELILVPRNGDYKKGEFRLAYKFDIYADKPLSRNYVYVDAITGDILHKSNRLHDIDIVGTGMTKYSGSRDITADFTTANIYRLREAGRKIQTLNMQTGTNQAQAVDFTDADNYWNNVNAAQDEVATDGHWGTEMTYDFYFNTFNRNSIDGNGMTIKCYMHYDANYANAFWDGSTMNIGDGDNTMGPLAALDIMAHEMTHGVTQYEADLTYQGEPGGLNESFSDVLGTAAEFYAKPNASWLLGNEIGVTIRSMSNPNAEGQPDTYLGQYWASTAATAPDNGGVHTNSGVQNFWYYLLCQGGGGMNDNNVIYNISPIGMTKATAIAYRNLSSYLTATSDYADARQFSIQSAVDLYGPCTNEVITTANAWHAVGVGNQFNTGPLTVDFTSDLVSGCSIPFTVNFASQASNAANFSWNFGDGTTGLGANTTHTYNSYGTYNVTLNGDAGACGADTLEKVSYIDINQNNPCVAIMPSTTAVMTQNGCAGTLYDSGGPSANYQDQLTSTTTITSLGANSITLTFTAFDLEANYDYLKIYTGTTATGTPVANLTGTNIPNAITINSSSVTIVQQSDQAVNGAGFTLNWACSLPTAPPVTNFSAANTVSCDGVISFTDLSTNGPASWSWDFGDGTTGTGTNPTHTYTQNGTYSVTLTTTNAFGTDNEIKTAYITVNRPAAPTAPSLVTTPINTPAVLTATGTGTLIWYDATHTQVGTGSSYTTSPITGGTTYYVAAQVPGATANGGPATNTIGGGGNFNTNAIRHLKFDVQKKCTLKTVKIYAQGAGNRTVELRDAQGTSLLQKVVTLVDGMNVATLDMPLNVGSQFQLGVPAGSTNINMYRNNAGASFPYNISNLVSITGTDVTTSNAFYYYYYDWVVEEEPCMSLETEIQVKPSGLGIQATLNNGTIVLYPNPGNGLFTLDIQNGNVANMQVKIYDIMGKLVSELPATQTDSFHKEINLNGLAKGTYLLQIQVGSERVFQKYILE